MSDISDLTDGQVVSLVTGGSKEDYAEIISRYQDRLLRYAGYLSADPELAADIVQESFIKAYINLKGFDTRRQFSAWIYRIVHNQAVNVLTKKSRHVPLDNWPDLDSGQDLEEDVVRRDLAGHARKCLSLMPLLYSEPLSLYYLEEKSYEEISDILRIPVGTVGTRINRAKALMKKICQKK